MLRGTACSRHGWSRGIGYSGTYGPGGPFIPNMNSPGVQTVGGTISSMTGQVDHCNTEFSISTCKPTRT